MADDQYIYAVARIRSKEMSLLSSTFIEQLLSAKTYEECIRLLTDKGWDCEGKLPEEILLVEREKTWELIRELVQNLSVFHVFLYENDFHNLKAAIKQICSNQVTPNIYKTNGTIDANLIYEAVKNNAFHTLPSYLQQCGQEAYELQLKSRDSQMCDVIIDQASLEMTYEAGKKIKE